MIPFNNMASLVEAVDTLEWSSNAAVRESIDAWKDTKRCCRCKQWRFNSAPTEVPGKTYATPDEKYLQPGLQFGPD